MGSSRPVSSSKISIVDAFSVNLGLILCTNLHHSLLSVFDSLFHFTTSSFSYPSFSVLRLVVLLKLHHYSLQEWLLREAVVQTCFVIKVLLEISQNSQENTCARDSFLIKLQALFSCEFCEISKNTFFYRTLWFCIEVSCFSFSGWIASSAMYSVWEPFIKLSISSSSALSGLSNHA